MWDEVELFDAINALMGEFNAGDGVCPCYLRYRGDGEVDIDGVLTARQLERLVAVLKSLCVK